jgi:Ca2+-binding RTX toxin-like protein
VAQQGAVARLASEWTISYEAGDQPNDVTITQGANDAEYLIDDVVPIEARPGCTHPDEGDLTLVACTIPDPASERVDVWAFLADGNDVARVEDAADLIAVQGQAGDDELSGGGSQALLWGGLGDDVLSGAEDMWGDVGSDQLTGGESDDILRGGGGRDTILGEGGDDELAGDGGQDQLHGGDGNDYVYGHSGDDVLYGEAGNDNLYGMDGEDELYGAVGDDVLWGGKDTDHLVGGPGNDEIRQDD